MYELKAEVEKLKKEYAELSARSNNGQKQTISNQTKPMFYSLNGDSKGDGDLDYVANLVVEDFRVHPPRRRV